MLHDPEVDPAGVETAQPTEVSEILNDAKGALQALGELGEDMFQGPLGEAVHDNLLRQLHLARPYLQHPDYTEHGSRSDHYYETLEKGLGHGRTGPAARKFISGLLDIADGVIEDFTSGASSWVDIKVDADAARLFNLTLVVLSHLSGNAKSGRGIDTHFKHHPPKFPPLTVVEALDEDQEA